MRFVVVSLAVTSTYPSPEASDLVDTAPALSHAVAAVLVSLLPDTDPPTADFPATATEGGGAPPAAGQDPGIEGGAQRVERGVGEQRIRGSHRARVEQASVAPVPDDAGLDSHAELVPGDEGAERSPVD